VIPPPINLNKPAQMTLLIEHTRSQPQRLIFLIWQSLL